MSVKLKPQYLYNDQGERRSVLLTIEEFQALLEELEYQADCLAMAKAIEESSPDDFLDWEDVKKELRALGKIQ